jgi:cyclophilin family peptidyl-prolyl cis-trans isomerase/HEAT repeat protein
MHRCLQRVANVVRTFRSAPPGRPKGLHYIRFCQALFTAELAKIAEKILLCGLCALCGFGILVRAQTTATRLAVLQAGDRRAPTSRDLAIIQSGARSGDGQTARVAVRALGRLERPSVISDIIPALRHPLPEVRAEAAAAIGQAAQGWKGENAPPASALDTAVTALVARLKVEAESDVRAAICDTIGRLPYRSAAQVEAAERTLLEMASRVESVTDRLGVAKGFEALVRIHRKVRAPGGDAVALLRRLATPSPGESATGARVRRLALEALIAATAVDDGALRAVGHDPDAQVRRLAMRATAPAGGTQSVSPDAAQAVLTAGMRDPSPAVRLEALRSRRARGDADACAIALAAVADRDTHVALLALDGLGDCGSMPDGVAALERTVTDLPDAASARGWHRAAHGLVALAVAAPEHGAAALARFAGSPIWQLRMYAARAAAVLRDREALDKLAKDDDDKVREAAVDALRKLAGHEADEIFMAGLSRSGNQIVRLSALALEGTPNREQAVPALRAAWRRLVAEGRDNSHDARDAIASTMASLGAPVGAAPAVPMQSDLDADDLRRLASPRARITIRQVGMFELALFTTQAPAAVLRFARLAEAGYYNGLTFHRVVPNFVIQGGSPGANEYVGDARFMRDEVGLWPHVRGAVGVSTRGRDTGDAQIFIDLVDNPRLDHEYTVFAQVLNGIEIVDQVLEGDVIDRVEIIP